MILSVVVLGYEDTAKNFIAKFKELAYYKKRDTDSEGVRISSVHVEDPNLLDAEYVYRYEMSQELGFANVLKDGDQESKKEIHIGNDTTWLLSSNGHDTIFEAVGSVEIYFDLLVSLISKGPHWVFLTSNYTEEQKAKINEASLVSGARVVYEPNLEKIMEDIDVEYKSRVDAYRKKLLEQSLTETPCGVPKAE